jgi:hypothetical protein
MDCRPVCPSHGTFFRELVPSCVFRSAIRNHVVASGARQPHSVIVGPRPGNWVRSALFALRRSGVPARHLPAVGRNWVRFAHLPSGRAQLGSLCTFHSHATPHTTTAFAHIPRAPQVLASFGTISSVSRLRRGEIGFVLHPQPASFNLQSRNWVRFAHLPSGADPGRPLSMRNPQSPIVGARPHPSYRRLSSFVCCAKTKRATNISSSPRKQDVPLFSPRRSQWLRHARTPGQTNASSDTCK